MSQFSKAFSPPVLVLTVLPCISHLTKIRSGQKSHLTQKLVFHIFWVHLSWDGKICFQDSEELPWKRKCCLVQGKFSLPFKNFKLLAVRSAHWIPETVHGDLGFQKGRKRNYWTGQSSATLRTNQLVAERKALGHGITLALCPHQAIIFLSVFSPFLLITL